MRLKVLIPSLCALCLTLIFAACQDASPPPDPEETVIFYNDYLGLSIAVPKEWHINYISETPQTIDYGEGSSRLELLDIQSAEDSTTPEHSRFYAYAEIFAEQQEGEPYLDLLEELLLLPVAEYSYEVQKREQVPLARHTAERICLHVSIAGSEQTYTEEYYVVQLGQAFIVFYINYWPQNEVSRAAAYAMLDNITWVQGEC